MLLLSVYLPCDNHSCTIVDRQFNDTINSIASLLNTLDCNVYLCYGDWNVSSDRNNTHTSFLINLFLGITYT